MTDEREGLLPGTEQLQAAARAVIDAARAWLDAAEQLVSDPASIQVVVASVRDVARDAFSAFGSMARTSSPKQDPVTETIDVREESLDG